MVWKKSINKMTSIEFYSSSSSSSSDGGTGGGEEDEEDDGDAENDVDDETMSGDNDVNEYTVIIFCDNLEMKINSASLNRFSR